MSRAGQAGEVGSVFRCAVATHLAVHGLRSSTISGFDLPDGIYVVRLDFETDDPTDDIRATFSDGRCAYISAKRRVTRGKPLAETVKGWSNQAQDLRPDDFFVLAGEDFSGPMRVLERVLKRRRAGLRMETKAEREALSIVTNLIPAHVRTTVLDRAHILHIQGSTDVSTNRDLLSALMDLIILNEQGSLAVAVLADMFHSQSGQALGSGIDDWVATIRSSGLEIIEDGDGVAGSRAALRLAALSAYRSRLASERGRIDLTLLADDVPSVFVSNLIDGLRVDLPGSRSSDELVRCVRRWRRVLLVGQPGAGKSVATREIAACCASDPNAPTPIRVTLSRLLKQQPQRLTLDGLIAEAIQDMVGHEHFDALADHLSKEQSEGRLLILCDGLDECGARAPWVAEQLKTVLELLNQQTGFILTTRASGQLAAVRLGLPRAELVAPDDLAATIDCVLLACAEVRVQEGDRDAWLHIRRQWMTEAKNQHPDLFNVPLLAMLLALICAAANESDLPKGRAMLLHRAVQQSVERWEVSRELFGATRPWLPALSTGMLLQGFVVLGRVLDGGVTPTRAEALTILDEMLVDLDRWAMAPSQAHEVAEQVLRFWDEHVAVFVVSPGDQLTARSRVFAEIATAMCARDAEGRELRAWLSSSFEFTDSDGAIALAAGLDSRVIQGLLDIGDAPSPDATLMVTTLVQQGVAKLEDRQLDQVEAQLRKAVLKSSGDVALSTRGPRNPPEWAPSLWDATREPGPWPFIEAASLLPVSAKRRPARVALIASAGLEETGLVIATALCALQEAEMDVLPLNPSQAESVHRAISLPLPADAETKQVGRRRFELLHGGRLAPGLAVVAKGAAGRLRELSADAGEQCFEIGMRASHGVGSVILDRLAAAGFDTSKRWKFEFPQMAGWVQSARERQAAFLADLTSLSAISNDGKATDLWSLTALGNLLSAAGYPSAAAGDVDAAFALDSTELRRAWLGTIADAYGIDKRAVAEQAAALVQQAEGLGVSDLNSEWFVAGFEPAVKPALLNALDSVLTAQQKRTLELCLDANSDWIALSAANVLINATDKEERLRARLDEDLSSISRFRASLIYSVAILCAGEHRVETLKRAATSEVSDRRYAARITLAIGPYLDTDGSIMNSLQEDPDLAVRPKQSFNREPLAEYWTCNYCRSVNDLVENDCLGCQHGVRPAE